MGGILTFEFRQPHEFVKAMTFLDSKGPETPDVIVFFGEGQSITIDTMTTGGHSVYKLPLRTSLYRQVTRIEVNTTESGYISSLEDNTAVEEYIL